MTLQTSKPNTALTLVTVIAPSLLEAFVPHSTVIKDLGMFSGVSPSDLGAKTPTGMVIVFRGTVVGLFSFYGHPGDYDTVLLTTAVGTVGIVKSTTGVHICMQNGAVTTHECRGPGITLAQLLISAGSVDCDPTGTMMYPRTPAGDVGIAEQLAGMRDCIATMAEMVQVLSNTHSQRERAKAAGTLEYQEHVERALERILQVPAAALTPADLAAEVNRLTARGYELHFTKKRNK